MRYPGLALPTHGGLKNFQVFDPLGFIADQGSRRNRGGGERHQRGDRHGRRGRLLRDDMRDAGLPEYDGEGHKLVFHSFRHTTGTWLCENGVDLKVVQEVLGHQTFTMTADRYTHARLERVVA